MDTTIRWGRNWYFIVLLGDKWSWCSSLYINDIKLWPKGQKEIFMSTAFWHNLGSIILKSTLVSKLLDSWNLICNCKEIATNNQRGMQSIQSHFNTLDTHGRCHLALQTIIHTFGTHNHTYLRREKMLQWWSPAMSKSGPHLMSLQEDKYHV